METIDRVLIGFVVLIIFLAVVSFPLYYAHKNRMILDMVLAGANPVDAACALDADTYTSNLCVLRRSGF